MSEPTHGHGAATPGQSKPSQSSGNIRQSILMAVLTAGAGIALIGSAQPSAPLVETSRAQASFDAITMRLPSIALALPAELKAQSVLASTLVEPTPPQKDAAVLIPVTRFAAAPTDTAPMADLLHNSLPNELHPVPETAETPQALPAKIKGAFPRGLHPVIKHSMVEASRYLPEGWQLEFMNALRDAPGVWNGPHGKRDKTGGALAVDVWLVNPKGERLCNFKCTQNFEPYQTFMQMVKHIQDRDFPAYKNQGRWGGYFGGSYANDEMHYDLEPSAWTAAGNWEKGLFPQYAYFGKKSDVGKGMGLIAGYKLPATGTTLASMETPGPAAASVAVAAKTPAPGPAPIQVASLQATAQPAPAAQPTQAAAVRRVAPMQQMAYQWKVRSANVQNRQRYESDEESEARTERLAQQAEAREQRRYAQAERYAARRQAGRTARDYGDD